MGGRGGWRGAAAGGDWATQDMECRVVSVSVCAATEHGQGM